MYWRHSSCIGGIHSSCMCDCDHLYTEVSVEADVHMEHLPEKVIEDVSDISRWLINNSGTTPNANNTEFLKNYITTRSSLLIKSLTGLVFSADVCMYERETLVYMVNTLKCFTVYVYFKSQ